VSAPAASRSRRSAWSRVGIVLAGLLALDQATKQLVTSALERGDEQRVIAGIKIVNVRNTGVAFGQLSGGGAAVAIVVALAVVALLVYFARHAQQRWMWLPTGLLLGGALGNIIDRVRLGAVVDFIKLPYWPAFNVADAAITVAVIVLLLVAEWGDGARRSA
jgi:signal peptidase II